MKATSVQRWGIWFLLAICGSLAARGDGPTVRVGLYQNPPKVALSATGQPEGIFVDLIEAIAKQEGWTLEYVPGTWAEGLDRVATGEIDLMPDVAFTRERENTYAFHRVPVLSDWFQIYARPGGNVRSLLDLDGKRVAVLDHSLQQESFAKLADGFGLKTVLLPQPDFDAAFAAVARGAADAVIANRFSGLAHLRDRQIEDTAIIFNPTRVFFAAPRTGNPELLRAIDRQLEKMKADPSSRYYDSLRRWTSEDVGFHLPAWLKAAGGGLALLLGLVLVWNRLLKRQVALRTRELEAQNAENLRLYRRARESEEGLRFHARLLDSVRESVVASDADGRITYWSRGAENMYGYAAADVMGRPYRDFAGAVEPPDEEAFRREVVARGAWHGEHLQRRRDGTTFWTSTVISPVLDARGEPAGFIGIDRDITERKQAEAALREERARFATLFDANPAGLMLVDRETRSIVQVNAAAAAMIGLPAAQIEGRTCHGFVCVAEQTHCPVCDLGQTLDCSERALVRADGRQVPIFKTVVPLTLGGRPVLLESFIDVSERKKAETERERLQAQLIQAQKMESVGRLAGGIAHDFNNMLGAILGYVELMLAGSDPAQPHHADLLEIRKTVERSSGLVRQLLAFARQQPASPRPLDLNAVVEEMLRMLRRLIGENVDLEWRPGPTAGLVEIDPVQIDQILVNLCVNARDAIAKSGHVVIETDGFHLDEQNALLHSGRLPGDYAVLVVSDDGIGMNAETLDKLFEPFFTTKDVGKGTGMGLATVYGIVQQNGGFIDVQSEVGRGTQFRIHLPRRGDAPKSSV